MSAKTYNDIRRILFSTANDPMKGFSCAYEYLEKTYKRQLDNKEGSLSYIFWRLAEILFFAYF